MAACTAIITTEMLERLAVYGLTANLVLFLNCDPFEWLAYEAANTLLIFLGIVYMCSVLHVGGWIADTMLEHFKTILISFIIYICGSVLLIVVGYAKWKSPNDIDVRPCHTDDEFNFTYLLCGCKQLCPISTAAPIGPVDTAYGNATVTPATIRPNAEPCPRQHYCGKVIMPALLLIAIGTGTIRSNLSSFGADQVKYEGPEVMRMFFNWFYWAINAGTFISIGAVVCIHVQQNINFFWGFLIPGIALVLSTSVFVFGRMFYLSKKPMGSVLTNTRRIIGGGVSETETTTENVC